MQHKFFSNGFPVSSTMALNGGDFKLCGEIMGMSVIQGGPAPNFLASQVVSYLLGKQLEIGENKTPRYKMACESVSIYIY